MKYNILVIVFLFFAPLKISAQDTITLQAVEVKARAEHSEIIMPLSRTIDTLALSTMLTHNMSNLLMQHSPIFIKTQGPGGLSTASFRGTTASHTLVLWNGFQLNAPNLGQVDFSTIPVFMVDDVRVDWGSGTAANSGGLGGVVKVDNKLKFDDGFLCQLKQSFGSFNTFGTYATIGYSTTKITSRLKIYHNSSENDFEYYNSALIPHQRMRQINASFTNYGFMPEVHLKIGKGIFTVVSWNQWNNRNLPPIMTNVENVNTEEWSNDKFSRNILQYQYFWKTGNAKIKSAYFLENQQYYLETRNPFTHDIITFINTSNQSNIAHQIVEVEQTLYKTWKLNLKSQFDEEKVVSNYYSEIKTRNVFSLFAALNGKVVESFDTKLTLRHDFVDSKSMGFYPTITCNYAFPSVKGLSLAAAYSHNYRNPSLNDLYWYPGGNENLLAEQGKTFDFSTCYSMKTKDNELNANIGFYASKVNNWIQWVPTLYRFWEPENVALVYARGLECHFDFNTIVNTWKLSVSLNYSYTITTDQSANNGNSAKQLIYIPKHHGNAFLTALWRNNSFNYSVEFSGLRTTSYSDDSYLAYYLPAYVIHNLSFKKQFQHLGLELQCNNVLDSDYQNVLWRAMPGRNWMFALSFDL